MIFPMIFSSLSLHDVAFTFIVNFHPIQLIWYISQKFIRRNLHVFHFDTQFIFVKKMFDSHQLLLISYPYLFVIAYSGISNLQKHRMDMQYFILINANLNHKFCKIPNLN